MPLRNGEWRREEARGGGSVQGSVSEVPAGADEGRRAVVARCGGCVVQWVQWRGAAVLHGCAGGFGGCAGRRWVRRRHRMWRVVP